MLLFFAFIWGRAAVSYCKARGWGQKLLVTQGTDTKSPTGENDR